MSYRAYGEVQTSVCTSDSHCGSGYLCCQGTCATPDEILCAHHPKYESKYAPPPPSDTPPPYSPPSSKPADQKTSRAGMVGGVLVAVGLIGGLALAYRKKRRSR